MTRNTDGTESTLSRRDVLAYGGAAAAAAGGGLALGSDAVEGRVTRRAVIPRAEDFTNTDYTGFFLHIQGESTGDIDDSVIANCDFANWSPGATTAYNGALINRLEKNHRQVPTELFVNDKDKFSPGTLWVINNQSECPNEYVGVQIEQLGARIVQKSTESPTETPRATATPGGGPGMGPLAALAGGVVGVAELLRRRS